MSGRDIIVKSGNPLIDDGHKILASLVAELASVEIASAPIYEYRSHLHNFLASLRRHFLQEEVILRGSRYSGAATHQTYHKNIIRELEEIVISLPDNANIAQRYGVINRLEAVLFDHELIEDGEFIQHLQRHGGDANSLWTADMKLGLSEIDKQHQRLCYIFADLEKKVLNKCAKEEILSDLKKLRTEVVEHFLDEEELLKKSDNSDRNKEHKKHHNNFVDEVNRVIHEYSLDIIDIEDVTKTYLRYLLLDHITINDKADLSVDL